MDQFKFSPGPWAIDKNQTAIVRLSECLRIEQTFEGDNFTRFLSEKEMLIIGDANAKLIASSPEMIDELVATNGFLLRLHNQIQWASGIDWDELAPSLRYRIAKQIQIIDKATK